MKKLKVATIIGTRPEIIRLSLIIKKCDQFFDHTLIHTGQNYDYELNEIFFNELEIRKPDYFFEVASKSLGDTLGNIISKSFEILNKIKKLTKTPIVAIGGINFDNYKKLLLNNANLLAISSYVWNNKKYKPLETIVKIK